MLVYLLLVIILIGAFIMWFLLNIRHRFDLVPGIDEKLLKRIRRKNKVCEDYAVKFLVLGVMAILGIITYAFIPNFGKYIAVVLIVIGALNLGNFSSRINDDIKRNKY